MKKSLLPLGFLLMALLLAACAKEEPYQQHQQALERFHQAQSFTQQRTGSVTNTSTDLSGTTIDTGNGEASISIVRSEAGDNAIMETTFVDEANPEGLRTMMYFVGDQVYGEYRSGQGSNYRSPVAADFAFRLASTGIIDFPRAVVAEQSATETEQGLLLSFVLDGEKFYAHLYPETYAEDGYQEYTYRENPTYSVLLDREGRIAEINSAICMLTTREHSSFAYEQVTTFSFSEYDAVELVFPPLNDEDYPLVSEEMYSQPKADKEVP